MRHKFFRKALAAAAVSAAVLSGCARAPADSAEDTGAAASEASEQTSGSVSETEAETSAETESAEESYNEPEYVKVSEGNEFIDFEFIEDYQGTTDIGELADKAVKFLMTTEEYAESMKNISEFSDEEFADYIEDGVIVPKFGTAYPSDYDGDGTTETFIAADMPVLQGEQPLIRSFFIFADSGGHMTLLADESHLYGTILLDYGSFKQLIWGGFGTCGADENTSIYGVTDGQAKHLYGGRFAFRKENCFLTTYGHMSGGDFMYYDTEADEYVPIAGVEMTLDEIKAMDKDGALADYYEGDEYADRFFGLVGGKYYCVLYGRDITEAVFTFDGKFERVESSNVRLRFKDYYRSGEAVIDIDINKALAEMKKPVEPYAQVSEGNEFIDYEFIENCQGTTDIGVLAAGAVEFLTESEYYAESAENIGEFTGDEFKKYFDEAGNILPRLRTAYPEDYDGDGSTETFIIVDMPYMIGIPTERSFLIFADSMGEMTILANASGLYETTMLNYGDFKQLTFGGSGTCGADEYNDLYGVVNGKAKELYGMRGGFYKKDCFLSVFGAQGGGAFMYYDTVACEYRAIAGEDIPIEKIKEMDSTGALSELYEWQDEHGFLSAELLGGRYYVIICGAMDTGTVYLYENSEFIQTEDCEYVRDSHYDNVNNVVLDIDITEAIAEMKSVK